MRQLSRKPELAAPPPTTYGPEQRRPVPPALDILAPRGRRQEGQGVLAAPILQTLVGSIGRPGAAVESITFTVSVSRKKAMFMILILLTFLLPAIGAADCISPSGVESRQIYSSSDKAPLFCDGSDWWIMKNIGATSKTLDSKYQDCNSTTKGVIRYDPGLKLVEFCDGTAWSPMAVTVTQSSDMVPDAFDFTDLTNQTLNTQVSSQALTITGFNGVLGVSLSGETSAEMSINGGKWITSAIISPGDSLRLRMNTADTVTTTRTLTITIGGTSDTWSTTTRAAGSKIFYTANTYSPSSFSGLAGADSICQTEATTAGYGGSWKAVISDNNTAATDRLTLDYPIVNACDDSMVEETNFFQSNHEGFIRKAGSCGYATDYVMTGSGSLGAKLSGYTCDSWSNSQGSYVYGRPNSTDYSWVDWSTGSCGTSAHLYCVSQPATTSPSGTADSFSFSDQTSVNLVTQIYSDVVTVSGFTGTLEVSISGIGNPEFSINGGDYSSLTRSIGPGDTLQLRTTTRAQVSTTYNTLISVGTTSDTWSVTTRGPGSKIFYTASTYAAATLGGSTGADTICQSEADAQSYGGTWKAVISTRTEDAASRLNIVYPVTNGCNNTLVELSDLWNSSHEGIIRQAGSCGSATNYIVTGTYASGQKAGSYTCIDWSSSSGSLIYGRPNVTDYSWVNWTTSSCSGSFYLYCISQ